MKARGILYFALCAYFLAPRLFSQTLPILSLTFEGNVTFDSGRLKSQLKMAREGGWYNAESFKLEMRSLQQFYEEEGFLRAKIGDPSVEVRSVAGRGQMAAVRVTVSEGARYTVGEVGVKDVQVFKPATLLQMCPLRTGQPYSRRKVSDWREKMEDAYHTMGHIRVEIREKEEVRDARRVVDLSLEFKEGPEYRVGKISVVGDPSINPMEFKKQLLLGQGSLYNPEMISLSLAFLNQMRTHRPIAGADVEIKIDDEKNTVDLIFHVVPLKRPSSSSLEIDD